MISLTCPKCNAVLQVPDDLAGKRGKCQSCGTILDIPAGQTQRGFIDPSMKSPAFAAAVGAAQAQVAALRSASFLEWWRDFVNFRAMIFVPLVKWLFWIMTILVLISGILMAVNPEYPTEVRIYGLLQAILGPVYLRLIAELLIVVFRINEELKAMRNKINPD